MTTIVQYVNQLRQRQRLISTGLGVNLGGMAAEPRVVLTLSNASLAVIVKILVDKGVITDAEVIAALNAAMAEVFTPEPGQPEPDVPPHFP